MEVESVFYVWTDSGNYKYVATQKNKGFCIFQSKKTSHIMFILVFLFMHSLLLQNEIILITIRFSDNSTI